MPTNLSSPLKPDTELRLRLERFKEQKKREAIVNFEQDPVVWGERHFHIPELKGPIKLYPHQKAVLREAYKRDENGRFKYSIVVWSDIKKSAKSSIAALVAIHRALMSEWGSIKVIANDLKQADSRVAYYLRRAITLNASYFGAIKQSGYKTTFSNKTIVEAIPIDPGGEAGGNDDLIIFSELWAAKNQAIQTMWTEGTLSPTKFGYSQRWVETYAGHVGQSPILEGLYERGVKNGTRLDLRGNIPECTDEERESIADLEVYANGDMLCLWNTKPRLPFQTPEYYASEEAVLTPNEFLRVHKNQWLASSDSFLPDISWWNACQTTQPMPPLTDREDLILAVDGAASNDNFGIIGLTRDIKYANDGTITRDVTQVRYARRWEPPKGGQIQFTNINDPLDRSTPEGEIRYLCTHYNVIVVAYDPMQLVDMMQRLVQENLVYCKAFNQQGDRLKADRQLRDNIRDRVIEHDGTAVHLTEHLMNADAAIDGDTENKLRIVKRSDSGKIDLAVCLSMANYVARKWNL